MGVVGEYVKVVVDAACSPHNDRMHVQRTDECYRTREELSMKIAAFPQFEMSLKLKMSLVIDVYIQYDSFSFFFFQESKLMTHLKIDGTLGLLQFDEMLI